MLHNKSSNINLQLIEIAHIHPSIHLMIYIGTRLVISVFGGKRKHERSLACLYAPASVCHLARAAAGMRE